MKPTPTGLTSGSDLTRDLVRMVVAAAFAKALDLESVDPADNFFHLDGDSLSALRVLSEIRLRLGREVSFSDFFAEPTIDALVEHVVARAGVADVGEFEGISRGERPRLSLNQEGLWFQARLEGGTSSSFNLPIFLTLTLEPNTEALAAALTDLVTLHESLRTVYPEEDGLPYQLVLDPTDAVTLNFDYDTDPLDIADQGFDITVDPPLRASLTCVDGDLNLVLVLHHLACDGASLPILLDDLDHAYAARFRNVAPTWGKSPVQYATFSAWQRARLLEDDDDRFTPLAKRQMEFWAGELVGLPAESPLPTDRPRHPLRIPASGMVELPLSSSELEQLSAVCRRIATTSFMVVQAAYAAAIGEASGVDTVVIGVPVSIRSHPALVGSVGMFVTMLPLRTEALGDRSPRDLLESVRTRNLSAFENADISFAHIVAAVNPPRSSGIHPLVQHALTIQAPTGALSRLPHLAAIPSYGDLKAAKYDLTLGVVTEAAASGSTEATTLRLEYATDLFEESTAYALLRSTHDFLKAILAGVMDSQKETS